MKNKANPSLTDLADAAFKQAARKVIERAEQSGTPVIVLESGAKKEQKTHSPSRMKVVPDADK
jgi:ABC-type sugar transport system substrate-binding protein